MTAVQLELLQQPVAVQHDLLLAAAADELNLELGRQLARGGHPGFIERTVIDEGDHQLPTQRREEFGLEQPALEGFRAIQPFAQARHGFADRCGRSGEFVDRHGLARVRRIVHRVIDTIAFMPNAEFRPHAVVQRLRAEDLGFGQAECRKVRLEAAGLGVKLGVILVGVEAGKRHVRLCEKIWREGRPGRGFYAMRTDDECSRDRGIDTGRCPLRRPAFMQAGAP